MKKLRIKSLSHNGKINFVFASVYLILIIASLTVYLTTYSEYVTKTHIWDGEETATAYASGNGTSSNPYLISDGKELNYFRTMVDNGTTYAGNYFQVTNDIDLDGKNWDPIGTSSTSFRGVFDGAGHVIKNVRITTSSSANTSGIQSYGFFASLGGGTSYAVVKNVVFDNITIDMNYSGNTSTSTNNGNGIHVGTVTGDIFKYGQISNVIVRNSNITQDGTVTPRSQYYQYFVGGLVGFAVNSLSSNNDPGEGARYIIDNCYVDTDIDVNIARYSTSSWWSTTYYYQYLSQTSAGGIIGAIRGQAVYPTNSLYNGSIDMQYGFVGPIFGQVRSTNGAISSNTNNFATVYAGNEAGTVNTISSYYTNYRANGTTYTSARTSSNSVPGNTIGVNKGTYTNSVSSRLDSFNTNTSNGFTWLFENNNYSLKSRLTGTITENPNYTFAFSVNDLYNTGTYTNTWYLNGTETSVTNNTISVTPSLTEDKIIKIITFDGTYYGVTEFTVPRIELHFEFDYDSGTKTLTARYAGSGLAYYDVSTFSETWSTEDISGYNHTQIAKDVLSINLNNYETGTDFNISATNGEYSFEGVYSYGEKKIVYLDYENGSNYNNCDTPENPCETMSGAYNKLLQNGSRNSNVIVLMNNYSANSYFQSANDSTYAKKATITGVYKGIDYDATLYFDGYGSGSAYKFLNEDTTFQYLTLNGASGGWYGGNTQSYFYLQGFDLTMGEGVVMSGYANSNTNQGLITGTAPAFHVFGGWLQYNQSTLPRNNQKILIKSGTYGRIIMGGSNGQATTSTMQQTTSRNFLGSSYDDMFTSELTIDIVNSTKASNYTYDVNLVVGGSAWGNMYANITENIKSGNIGRILGASIGDSSYTLNNWNYPLNTFIGHANINITGGTVKELYGGALGRNMNALSGSSSVVCDSYFYGDVNILVDGGTVNGNIYGAGAGGVSGYHANSTDNYKERYGKGVDTSVNIRIKSGVINGNIYGGGYGYTEYLTAGTIATDGGTLYGNSNIVLDGGRINGNVYGAGKGYTSYNNRSALAQMYGDSEITISDNAQISGAIYGAGEGANNYQNNAKMTGNSTINLARDLSVNVYGAGNIAPLIGTSEININGGTQTGTIYGGGKLGVINGSSTVNIVAGDSNDVYGGGEQASVTTTNVKLMGGTVSRIFGGAYDGGSVTKSNILTTSGVAGVIYGGNNLTGTTTESEVVINGGSITSAIYGGGLNALTTSSLMDLRASDNKIPNIFAGGESAAVTNTVTEISGVTAENIFGGSNQNGVVESSTIRIGSGTVDNIYGGNNANGQTNYTYLYSNPGTGTIGNIFGCGKSTSCTESNVVMQGGKSDNIFGGSNTNGEVTTSNVTANSGEVNNLYGGNNQGGTVVTSNVSITGGKINGKAFGGGNAASTTHSNVHVNASDTLIPFVFGGGNAESVSDTHVIFDNGVANYVFGGSNSNGTITEGHVTINGGEITNVYGGNNQGGLMVTSDVSVISGAIIFVYGGNNEQGSTTNANVSITGGNVRNAYGGGNAAMTGATSITIDGATIDEIVYGGGNAAGVTNNTDVNIINSNINGNVFGGGNSGVVGGSTDVFFNNSGSTGSVHGGGNGVTAIVYGNTTLNIDGASTITGNVFGGGNAAPVGIETNNNSISNVNIVGGHIGGNVYGGANTSVVYGRTNVKIGSFAVNNNYLTVSNINIDGTVFGGGEANAAGASTYDWKFISVTDGTSLIIDGRDYTTFEISGSVFGSGNASTTKGTSVVTIRNYGTSSNYKTLTSIQRTDYAILDKSHILLLGTIDSTASHDTTLFSLNIVEELELTNNSTLYMKSGANLLQKVRSTVDISGVETKASVTIDENGAVTKNVDNRLYSMQGVDVNIALTENLSEYGPVEGMTFFGLFTINSQTGRVDTSYYGSSYETGTAIPSNQRYHFTSGSSVTGKRVNNQNVNVDGFYSNFFGEEDTSITQRYIDPTPKNKPFYIWHIGEEVSSLEVTLTASKFSTLGTKEIQLRDFSSPNTTLTIIGFNYDDLDDDVSLVSSSSIPRLAASDTIANTTFGLTVKSGVNGWQNSASTELFTNPDNPFEGTSDYMHENSDTLSSLVFYLYHSKNVTSTESLGQVVITFIASTPDPEDDLHTEVRRINVYVNLETALYSENEYEGSIKAGKEYSLFATTPVNITTDSTFSAYFSLFGISNESIYKNSGYHHTLVSKTVLPENTKITMVDLGGANPEYYYYIITAEDVASAQTEYNTNMEASYNISKFRRMGSTSSNTNYDEVAHQSVYYNPTTKYAQEEFIFMLDFSEANITSDVSSGISFNLRDGNDQIIVNIMSDIASLLDYNMYYNANSRINLSTSLSSSQIYGGDSTTLSVNTIFEQVLRNNTTPVVDTAFYNNKLGIKLSILDSNGNVLNGNSIMGISYTYNGMTYYPNLDGSVRIKLGDVVANVSSKIIVNSNKNTMNTGDYILRVDSIGSPDGLYYGLTPSATSRCNLRIVDNIYGLDVTTLDNNMVINKDTGLNLNGVNANKYTVLYSSGLINPVITYSLERRLYDEEFSLEYEKVDLADYISNELTASNFDLEYILTTSPQSSNDQFLYFNSNLLSGTYKVMFKLYDGNTFVGSTYKYLIIK